MKTTLFIGKNLIELDLVESTNNYLSNLSNKTNMIDGTVILAHKQTKGKGERGNVWMSEDGKNLTFSLFLKTNFISLSKNFLISIAISNSIHEVVAKYTKKATIKWPNDILVDGAKICGILIENSIQNQHLKNSIIGIGLNVNQQKFLPFTLISSLSLIINNEIDKVDLLNNLFSKIEKNYFLLKQGEIEQLKDYYFTNLFGYNSYQNYLLKKENIYAKGKIIGIEDSGILIMEIENKKRYFDRKEIQLVL